GINVHSTMEESFIKSTLIAFATLLQHTLGLSPPHHTCRTQRTLHSLIPQLIGFIERAERMLSLCLHFGWSSSKASLTTANRKRLHVLKASINDFVARVQCNWPKPK
ncbi:unnamed protein product, partial [Ceratitis capitata]